MSELASLVIRSHSTASQSDENVNKMAFLRGGSNENLPENSAGRGCSDPIDH